MMLRRLVVFVSVAAFLAVGVGSAQAAAGNDPRVCETVSVSGVAVKSSARSCALNQVLALMKTRLATPGHLAWAGSVGCRSARGFLWWHCTWRNVAARGAVTVVWDPRTFALAFSRR